MFSSSSSSFQQNLNNNNNLLLQPRHSKLIDNQSHSQPNSQISPQFIKFNNQQSSLKNNLHVNSISNRFNHRRHNHHHQNNNINSATTCANCGTQTTPLWRRNQSGETLCNACALFQKMKGRPRPISLKTNIIKSRNRIKAIDRIPLTSSSSSTRSSSSSSSINQNQTHHQSNQKENLQYSNLNNKTNLINSHRNVNHLSINLNNTENQKNQNEISTSPLRSSRITLPPLSQITKDLVPAFKLNPSPINFGPPISFEASAREARLNSPNSSQSLSKIL